jgi:hypothetical protein
MKAATKQLEKQCQAALLEHDDEAIAQFLARWLAYFVGDDSTEFLDEDLDDMCLALGFRVATYGQAHSYSTYTAWWEVEGFREPGEGVFSCPDPVALRTYLSELSHAHISTLIELLVQVYDQEAESSGNAALERGAAGLNVLATWIREQKPSRVQPTAGSKRNQSPAADTEQQQQEWPLDSNTRLEQALARGYLVVTFDTPQEVRNRYRHWSKTQSHPTICVYISSLREASIEISLKPASYSHSSQVEGFT